MRSRKNSRPSVLGVADATNVGRELARDSSACGRKNRKEDCSPDEDALIAQATAILQRKLERGVAMTDPAVAGAFCASRLRPFDREVFAALFLDNRHRMIAFEILFAGTIDGAEVYPREVARSALKHNAAALIVTHNHPSGSSEPSAADRAVTLRLRDALSLLEIRLLDHFVIGDGPPTSLAARGWV